MLPSRRALHLLSLVPLVRALSSPRTRTHRFAEHLLKKTRNRATEYLAFPSPGAVAPGLIFCTSDNKLVCNLLKRLADGMEALKEWESFYVIVGSSAGALIGLQFVVMT